MKTLYKDIRFRYIIFANLASSIGSGITMIAIPWLLVSSSNGSEIFGYIAISMTIISFLVTPLIGNLIDKMSRKKLLLISKIISLIILSTFSLMGFTGVTYETWHYIILYMTGSLYYTIFYPAMFALNQELFSKEHYKSLNGVMEIQGQLSSVIAGALASILLTMWEVHSILLLNLLAYACAIYFYTKIPYSGKFSMKNKDLKSQKVHSSLSYMRKRPAMFIVLLFSTMPFIGVMVTNYLFPVYLADVLETSGSVYGIQSMIYALGAVTAGIIVPYIAVKLGEGKTIIFCMMTYTTAISMILFVNVPLYLALMFFIAIGNSGARVARNAFMMEQIPNNMIGRVDGLFRSIGLFLRILLLALFTGMVSTGLILYCFVVLGGLLILSSVLVIMFWKKSSKESDIQNNQQGSVA